MSKDIYINLFHGRTDPEQNLEDWGTEGPILGPFKYCHITYLGGFLKLGDDMVLNCFEDMVYYDGVFYGDFSILSGQSISNDLSLRKEIVELDPEKTIIPEQHREETRAKVYEVGVSRNYTHTGSVMVTASRVGEAKRLAMELINDIELKLGELAPDTDTILYVEEV